MMAKTVLRRNKNISTRLIRKVTHGSGELLVNGAPARFIDKVDAGDEILIVLPEEISAFPPEDIPLSILFEDEQLLVIDKQPGIVVHPTKGHVSGTIANAVQRYMEMSGQSFKIRFVNRLDMGTSGVLLVGKSSLAQSDFVSQAAAGRVSKEYLAIVTGRTEEHGVIDAPIDLEGEGSPKRTVKEDGYPSRTEYFLEKVVKIGGTEYSLLRLILHTGRTHQIRVHLAYIGHPVLSDPLYGEPNGLIGRQALHAHRLSFPHPITGEPGSFTASLPEDMNSIV
jgi:23S rRNA pseudouridine1911/1915/1917 synthase